MKHYLMRIKIGLTGLVFLALCTANSSAADVDVYGEGAYTDTDLVVYIYADIDVTSAPTATNILSYGVKLSYDTDDLTNPTAEKNENVWYLGDGTPAGNNAYMDPETSVSGQVGEVVFIGGKLDTADPLAGVGGTRVLLGEVSFDRVPGGEIPTVTLSKGRNPGYDNFVATDGTVLDGFPSPDGVSFDIAVHERGDANGDGRIDGRDIRALRRLIGTQDAPCWSDCDANESVDVRDIRCLRYKI